MECKYCKSQCKKSGLQKKGIQKYQCKQCKKYQQLNYSYKAYKTDTNDWIVSYIKESCGIRSISRLMKISSTTIIARIRQIAKHVKKRYFMQRGLSYEIDEMYTYIQNKSSDVWIIYAMERSSREVVELKVGRRTKEEIKKVVEMVLGCFPKRIYTDKLNVYPSLITKELHKAGRIITNKIERKNLTIRTHLKRLSRSTICFSKKEDMLEACLKIYFWR